MKKNVSILLLLLLAVLLASAVLAEQTRLTTTVPSQHALTLSCGEHGTIRVNGTPLAEGEEIQINRHEQVIIEIIPDAGYELDTATVSSDYGVSLNGNTIVVDKMVQDFTAKIEFKQSRLPGDADNNGLVNIYDVLLVLQYDAGWNVTLNASNADVNADNQVDLADALLILEYGSGSDVILK